MNGSSLKINSTMIEKSELEEDVKRKRISGRLPGGQLQVVSEAEGLVDVAKKVESRVHLLLDLIN